MKMIMHGCNPQKICLLHGFIYHARKTVHNEIVIFQWVISSCTKVIKLPARNPRSVYNAFMHPYKGRYPVHDDFGSRTFGVCGTWK